MNELDKIKQDYEFGRLDELKGQLRQFIAKHVLDILAFKENEETTWGKQMDLHTAVKLFILHVRTIDMGAEMVDQVKAIDDAIKKFGGHADNNQMCMDWVHLHAKGWRGYRVLAIIYVFDQNRDLLLAPFN